MAMEIQTSSQTSVASIVACPIVGTSYVIAEKNVMEAFLASRIACERCSNQDVEMALQSQESSAMMAAQYREMVVADFAKMKCK
jgi:hypothetical protein